MKRASGLQWLLGTGLPSTSRMVRDFVVETALGAIAEGFGAEAVVIARRDGADRLAVVSSRIPPSWSDTASLTFEVFGMLWYWLDRASYDQRADGEAGPLGGGRYLWIGCQPLATGYLAAAVVRPTRFTDAEQAMLNRLVRSVAVALGGERAILPPGTSLSAVAFEQPDGSGGGGDRQVEVCLDVGGSEQRATGSGETAELAAARAAARLCDEAYDVTFAGQTEIDGSSVSIVLVDDGRGATFLGLAVSAPGELAGAAEAVFSAVARSGRSGRS